MDYYTRRMRELVDIADIVDQKHAYLRAADALDPDRMVRDFVSEGFTASYDPTGEPIRGREAIREWYSTRLSTVVSSSHHVSNVEVEFSDPDTATLRCYLYSWQRFDSHPDTADRHRFARYIDTWVRVEGRWLQSSLTCLVAGEYCSDSVPRIGEYFDWDH